MPTVGIAHQHHKPARWTRRQPSEQRVGIVPASAQFVYAVLGSDWNAASVYGNAGERVHDLAMRGIRLVIDDFRADVTKTLKSGRRGRLRIAYGDHTTPTPPSRPSNGCGATSTARVPP